MKFNFLAVILLSVFAFPFSVSADLNVLDGEGTVGSPYLINSCDDWIVAAQNATDEYYELLQSIDCTEIDTPNAVIFQNAFDGDFDGNNNVITIDVVDAGEDLSYVSEDGSLNGAFGLFRFLQSGRIANLGVTGEFNLTSILDGLGYQYIDVGGMVGTMGYTETSPELINVFSDVNITTVDATYVGGLVGYLDGGSITNSYVDEVIIDSQSTVGGFIGFLQSGVIENSYTKATVNSSVSSTGGFIALMSGGTIDFSYSTSVVNSMSNETGGFVGVQNGGAITQSFSNGTVNGTNFVGGFIGQALGGTITNAYSLSSVVGDDSLGGFVGSLGRSGGEPGNAVITNAYSIGNVTGDTNKGGFAGDEFGGTVEASYWDSEVSALDETAP